jgi:hypothetical protein
MPSNLAIDKLAEVLIVVSIAAIMYVLYRWGHRSWGARIRGWAQDRQLHLLSYRIVSFGEGPDQLHRFARSENQTTLHVRVCDRSGRQRTAWLVFEQSFASDDELVDVFWDD